MKLKEFFKNFFLRIKEGISRFLVAFICSVVLFLTVSFEIIFETNSDEIIVPLCMAFAFGAVFSVLLKITEEYFNRFKIKRALQYALSIVATFVCFILVKLNYESLYMIMAYSGIMIALVCFIFYVLMRGKNRNLVFPKLVASLIFTGAVCGILSAGLSTCIAAFQSLIFDWDDSYKVYEIVNLFVWTVGYINIFLSFVPQKDKEVTQSKIFKAFVLFAGLPLYMLLITILLVYLAKIVITWNMPVGEINWFASFASLFFIFFLLSVMQYEEKAAKLFAKFGGYLLIPVLIMQAIAVFERINAYGLTTPRTVSLVLIVISAMFIGASLITPKHMNKIALASGIIVLIVTVTPLNVIDMPIASQTDILKEVLMANNMLKDGKVIPNENISDNDAEKILSAYSYLKYDAEKLPDFIPDSTKSTKELFGVENSLGYRDWDNRIYCYFETKEAIDITGYDRMVKADAFDASIEIEHKGQRYDVDLKEVARELYETYGKDQEEVDLYQVNGDIALYIESLSFNVENDGIDYNYFDGYVLLKN